MSSTRPSGRVPLAHRSAAAPRTDRGPRRASGPRRSGPAARRRDRVRSGRRRRSVPDRGPRFRPIARPAGSSSRRPARSRTAGVPTSAGVGSGSRGGGSSPARVRPRIGLHGPILEDRGASDRGVVDRPAHRVDRAVEGRAADGLSGRSRSPGSRAVPRRRRSPPTAGSSSGRPPWWRHRHRSSRCRSPRGTSQTH